MFGLYWFMPYQQAALTALSVSGTLVGLDVARLYSRRLNKVLTWLFQPFLRESERDRLAGSTFMLIGVTLIVLVFPKSVVLLTLLFFALADPLASYFGIRYGRDKLVGNKTVQGTLAAFAACFIAALAYFYFLNLMHERLFIVCLLSGLIGAFSEVVPVGQLDDNLVFPVTSAALLTGLFFVFGGL